MFVVANTISTPIAGLQTSEKFNLIKRIMAVVNVNNSYQDLLMKFAMYFRELGVLPREHHITLKNDVSPAVMPPRKVPIALKDKI